MKNSIYSIKDNRLEFIDIAKGLGIILVVIGHVSINNMLNTWIFSFHMPLFFVISGYLNSCNKKYVSNKKYIVQKFKRLLIPYFIFSNLSYIYWIMIERNIRGDNISVTRPFINIFIAMGGSDNYIFNAVMWFLPCLFITEVIFYYISKKNNKNRVVVLLIISSIIGYLISCYINTRIIWCIDIMFTSLVFYGIGYYGFYNKLLINDTYNNKKEYYLLLIISFLLLTIISQLNGRIDMNNNILQNYFMFYIAALTGVFFIFLISNKIKCNWLSYLGKNSLIIMLLHEPLKRIVLKIIELVTRININILRDNIFLIIICSALIISLIIPCIYVINKFIPGIIGKNIHIKVHNKDIY